MPGYFQISLTGWNDDVPRQQTVYWAGITAEDEEAAIERSIWELKKALQMRRKSEGETNLDRHIKEGGMSP